MYILGDAVIFKNQTFKLYVGGPRGGNRSIRDIMTLSTVVGGYVKIFKPVSLKWTNWYKGWYAKRKMKKQLVITGQNWTNWHFWWNILQSITHTYWSSLVF